MCEYEMLRTGEEKAFHNLPNGFRAGEKIWSQKEKMPCDTHKYILILLHSKASGDGDWWAEWKE